MKQIYENSFNMPSNNMSNSNVNMESANSNRMIVIGQQNSNERVSNSNGNIKINSNSINNTNRNNSANANRISATANDRKSSSCRKINAFNIVSYNSLISKPAVKSLRASRGQNKKLIRSACYLSNSIGNSSTNLKEGEGPHCFSTTNKSLKRKIDN